MRDHAGRTITEINLLTDKDRVTELARMFGGQTDAVRKHAEALLRQHEIQRRVNEIDSGKAEGVDAF